MTSAFERMDLPALSAALEAGTRRSVDVVREALARIEQQDHDVNSIVRLNPAALDEARTLDAEREQGRVRSSLHGVPIVIKDNIDTRGLPTTAGSLALADNVAADDAPVVARLRAAGMVVLGKTNLSEWANFRSTHSSSGWSAVGGQTRNPYDQARSPCGSSSGSGVAIAMGFVPAALGTETNGSIVCPASVNGIVGLKPTVGLVSRSGVVPISSSQDTVGPMTSTVAGAAMLLDAMVGHDSRDPATEAARSHEPGRYVRALRATAVREMRIGVVGLDGRRHPEIEPLLAAAVERLATLGATIVPDLRFEPPEDFRAAALEVLLFEFKATINAYLAHAASSAARNLDALIEFNRTHAAREMPHFGQELFERASVKGGLDDDVYRHALALIRRVTRDDGIDRLTAAHRLDALAAPTCGPAWTIDWVNGDHAHASSAAYPAIAGYPHVTVPMGTVRGLPVGLSLFGPAFSEPTLIAIAHAFEQHVTSSNRSGDERNA